jgi:hypothetical protein
MRVAYSKKLAWTILVLGLIQLVLQGWLLSMGRGSGFQIVPGIICSFVGIGYLTKPFFTVHADAVEFKALIGPMVKSLPYTPGQIRIENNALFVAGKKTGGRRWIADNADWDALAAKLNSADAFD